MDYIKESQNVYDNVFGEFYSAYSLAKAETRDIAKRYALMAIAEAKLLETGTILPLTANGGQYEISRIAPNTIAPTFWGEDSRRYHQALIVNEAPLTETQRNELKAIYAMKKGSGTYEASAKFYLTTKGFTLNRTYTTCYSSEPLTWDALATSRAADLNAIVNTYDGLYEYDIENQLKPALAASMPVVSKDGLTVTITLKDNVKWVNQNGEVIGTVKADDFVAGMQHMCDVAHSKEYLIQGIIKNANEYIESKTNFSNVGVKALDDTTLVYTLEEPCSYFDALFTYCIFAPLCRVFYEAKGGKFGVDFNPQAVDYRYGKTPADIAYCGPYLVTENTVETKMTFEANPAYWNKDSINITKIVWEYDDGMNPLKVYNGMKAGSYASCELSATSLAQAKEDLVDGTTKSWFSTYRYISDADADSHMGFFNVNRASYANTNDSSKAVSPKNDAEKALAKEALTLQDFRLALCYAFNREAYNAQAVGEDLALASLINSYTPGTFVQLPSSTTVKIGGEDKTYPAGTYYGEIMQDAITADGYSFKVWNPTADGGIGASSGFDGWYNEAAAQTLLAKAVATLEAKGYKIYNYNEDDSIESVANPIYIDFPCFSGSDTYINRARAFAQSVNSAFNGAVIINIITCSTSSVWYYAGYYRDYGFEANYDFYDMSVWTPNYGDPQTYLDTFLPDISVYMIKYVGIF